MRLNVRQLRMADAIAAAVLGECRAPRVGWYIVCCRPKGHDGAHRSVTGRLWEDRTVASGPTERSGEQ